MQDNPPVIDRSPDPTHPVEPQPAPEALSTWQWWVQGLRAGVFLVPRIGSARPAPLQILMFLAAFLLLEIGLGRLEVPGPASFDWQAGLAMGGVTVAVMAGTLWLAWWALWPAGQRSLAAWFALSTAAAAPPTAAVAALVALEAHQLYPAMWDTWLAWAAYLALLIWSLGAAALLMRRFGSSGWRVGGFVTGVLALALLAAWQSPQRPWSPEYSATDDATDPPRLQLSQEVFEQQQTVWQEAIDSLVPSRPGVGEVYGLVFAPYASENVFLRESTLVSQVLADRFDAHRRVLHLVNHATTADSHPWATTLNLQRGIEALAERMDKQRDLLVVYLTSHGGGDFKLASEHWPLETEPLTPQQLRAALDEAGIVNRVVIVSACYSGGWVEPLATDTTLVMTAADATHTSYGCGRLSELTFFGRALFDEQLRTTHSFEQAFAKAVPLIKAREEEAKKNDGFSNPQIRMGAGLAPVLKQLEQRLALEK